MWKCKQNGIDDYEVSVLLIPLNCGVKTRLDRNLFTVSNWTGFAQKMFRNNTAIPSALHSLQPPKPSTHCFLEKCQKVVLSLFQWFKHDLMRESE